MKKKIYFNLSRLFLFVWISLNVHSAIAQTNVINFSFTPSVDISVFNDVNQNCILLNEPGIAAIPVIIQPGNLITNSNSIGIASFLNLPNGTYTAFIDTVNLNWSPTCVNSQTFQVNNGTNACISFGMVNHNPCSSPEISILAPTLRRCFSNQIIYVSACNNATATSALNSSFVVVTLDPLLTVNSASLPFTSLGNNTFQFQTGTLNPGQCVDFTLSTTVSCNATLGQTLCMNAELFPVENCALDTLPSGPNWDNIPSEGALGGLPQPCLGPWDQSSLSVDGWCQNDSIYFTVTNTGVLGGGDMECYAPVWLTVNGVVTFTDSIMLQGGQTITYAFAGNGQTWILNASQHPLHPGNSQPNAFVERCGNAANWIPGEVNDYPQDDADPVIDIYCEEVSGSYDPNDKRGYPNGVTNMNYIQPNQQLQYVIRFQNTGTDTAFTVVIRDTLDLDLNIFTVTPGVSSHTYEFRMYGPRVLEWRFDNILLPDSTTNSVGSNGFVTFHVEQNPNLSPGTVINNDADIYLDFNDPITTNTTIHRIYEGFPNVLSLQDLVNSKESIVLYPNPTSSEITITSDKFSNEPYTLYDQMGRTVGSGTLAGTSTTISLSNLSKGIYILKVEGAYESAIVVKE
ncbi:MAG: T9SS type A sorting domain-containing protein [Flavobacteriales bacterium]